MSIIILNYKPEDRIEAQGRVQQSGTTVEEAIEALTRLGVTGDDVLASKEYDLVLDHFCAMEDKELFYFLKGLMAGDRVLYVVAQAVIDDWMYRNPQPTTNWLPIVYWAERERRGDPPYKEVFNLDDVVFLGDEDWARESERAISLRSSIQVLEELGHMERAFEAALRRYESSQGNTRNYLASLSPNELSELVREMIDNAQRHTKGEFKAIQRAVPDPTTTLGLPLATELMLHVT